MLELPDFVVSVDPGLKTGLSVLASEDGPRLCASAEVDVLEVESWLVAQMGMISRGAVLLGVIEKFTINARTVANTQAPWSLEVTGIARNTFWRERGLESIMQKPADVMSLFTNPRLRALDCWHKGGAGHANDSIRHGLGALYARGWRDRRLLSA